MKKTVLLALCTLLCIPLVFLCTEAFAQDTSKEPIAIGEFGPATAIALRGSRSSLGYGAAIETTPVEDLLELELGVSHTFASNYKETDIDFLFKKPWTLSKQLEFMFGVGPSWGHSADHGITGNSLSGEAALDFMFWPYSKRRFGWHLETAYAYDFGAGHGQSLGISCGLLIAIP